MSYVNDEVKAERAAENPMVSVDTKNKEPVGDYCKGGRYRRPSRDLGPVYTHDFPDRDLGRAIP